jgi:hypothetical protein
VATSESCDFLNETSIKSIRVYKAIPVRDRGGQYGCEKSLTDGG